MIWKVQNPTWHVPRRPYHRRYFWARSLTFSSKGLDFIFVVGVWKGLSMIWHMVWAFWGQFHNASLVVLQGGYKNRKRKKAHSL